MLSFFQTFVSPYVPNAAYQAPGLFGPLVLEKIFKGFLTYMDVAASWSCDPDVLNKLSFT